MIKRIIILLLIPLVSSCYDTELVFEEQYRAVLEAYVYLGKDVNNIKLSSMISFGSDSGSAAYITDALMVLETEDQSWPLVHDESDPGRYYIPERPYLNPGDSLKLRVDVDDLSLAATTVIPDDPPAVRMSSASLYIPKAESPMEFRDMEMPDPVEFSWENPAAAYYFLTVQNIEYNPEAIMPDPPDHFPNAGGGFAFQMVTRPTNDNIYMMEPRQITHYGTHRIIFTSINEEYVNLYNTLNQDSRELNEPYTNVENGLGIFTAFNSDTLYLEVIPVYQ